MQTSENTKYRNPTIPECMYTKPACERKILQLLSVCWYLIGDIMVDDWEERRPVLVLHGHPSYNIKLQKANNTRLNSLFHDNLKDNHLAKHSLCRMRKHTALESFLPSPDILDPQKFQQGIKYSVNIHVMN